MKRVIIPLVFATAAIGVVVTLAVREIKASPQGARGTAREYSLPAEVDGSGGLSEYAVATRITLDVRSPLGIACGPDGTVYVCGEDEVVVVDESGQVLKRHAIERPARCLAVGLDGTAYVGLDNAIVVLPADFGVQLEWAMLDERSIITSIAVAGRRVYIADAGTRKVWEYDTGGMMLGLIDRDFIIPSPFFDVALDPRGSLWIADTGRHTLLQVGADGEVLSTWGESAMDVNGFSGCCNPAHFAILPDGKIVTAEKGLQRIKLYTATGEFAGLIAPTKALGGVPEGLDIAVSVSGEIFVLHGASGEILKYSREGA